MNGAISPNRIPDAARPDFRHVRDWIFDLDNTLYRADCGVFAQIEGRMTDYVERVTALPRDDARALQKSLYCEHGTTLSGLMRLHGISADDYLSYVHDVDLSDLVSDAALNAAIGKLPGRRFIFTNGCRHHAGRVLSRIGLTDMFEQIWDIRTIGFTPKPARSAYDLVVAEAAITPGAAAMFEDIPNNLAAAAALGMTTVWLNTGAPFSHQGPLPAPDIRIDHETDDLAAFLNTIRI